MTAAAVEADARTYLSESRAYRMVVLPQSTAPAPTTPQPPPTGVATVNCAVAGARLTDCQVVREEPPGRGLGGQARAAAEKLSVNTDHPPKTPDGRLEIKVRAPLATDAN